MRATIIEIGDERQAERFSASKDAEIEAIGDDVYPAMLLDVSQRGFRVMVDGHLSVESLIRLKVGDFPALMARVVWINGTVYGCEFTEGISRAAIVAILRRQLSDQRASLELTFDEDGDR
jgi:hypothetical protein